MDGKGRLLIEFKWLNLYVALFSVTTEVMFGEETAVLAFLSSVGLVCQVKHPLQCAKLLAEGLRGGFCPG